MKANLKTALLLILINSIQIFPQQGKPESPETFYNEEKKNWLEKIAYESEAVADTSIDVKFYHLSIEVSLNPYIKGNVLCLFESKFSGLSEIKLDLTGSLDVDSVSGNASGFNHSGDTLFIQLDKIYTTGEEASVIIYYAGIPPVLNALKGMRYSFHNTSEPVIATLSTPYLAHLWFPCKDGPGDKADSVYIDITIPDTSINNIKLSASSNGMLEEIVVANGKRTFKWRERYPIVPYYVMMAVSNYAQFQQIYSDTSGTTFPIIYNVFREDSAASYLGVQELPSAIELFSGLFGAYPFSKEKYGMTQLGFYGAIENQTNTIQNTFDYSWFIISVHELSHMWFGDMITCADWHHGWLNEGFATYCEALWTEYKTGFTGYKSYMNSLKYTSGGTVYLQNINNPFGIFITIIYNKGAWVLHMLRGVLGDNLFLDAVKQYASDNRFRYKHASTEDFQEVCENISGTDLNYFFDQWIYDEYYPVYSYTYEQDTSSNLFTLHLNQEQSNNSWREVFTMPVEFKFNFEGGGDTIIVLWNDQKNQDFHLNLTDKVISVNLDPDGWILKTITSPTGIDEGGSDASDFYLSDNYPNPFNPATKIKYSIGSGSLVSLRIYDILGNEIEQLIDEEKDAGNYEVTWTANNFPSGVYFYELKAGAYKQMKKMILIK